MESNDAAGDLSSQLANLKVTADERSSVFHLQENTVDNSKKKLINALLCKILTHRKINAEVFRGMMLRIWGQENTVIDHMCSNVFLCNFKNARIKGYMQDDGPWFYDKLLLVMEEPRVDINVDDMEFRFVAFWVHFHKLPFACFNRSSAMEIGSLPGKVEQVDIEEDTEPQMGCSLRIKIQIDVQKPLKRGIFLTSRKGRGERWIDITYEKLPDFCCGCGRLGHTIRDCEDCKISKEEDLPYGPGLREHTRLKVKETNW